MPSLISWVAVISILGLVSCQNKTQTPPETPQKQDAVTGPGESEPVESAGPLRLRGQAEGLSDPHDYEIHLDWQVTNREPSTFYIVKRSDWNSGRVVQGEQGYFKDEEIQEGKEYLYQVQMINGSKSITSEWVKVQVPKDKVFEKDEVVQTETFAGYARLFFRNKVRISWLGEKVQILAQEIISEEALMESFSLDQKTAEGGFAGKSGGELILKAKKLKGSLFIRADGQNGGTGLEGAVGGSGEKGTVGPKTFLFWGPQEKYPAGAYRYQGFWFYCDPPRAAGTAGGAGSGGAQGLPGGQGGNSTKVLVDIEDTSLGDLFFTNKPGVGGDGGMGGPGGEGGEGGVSGEIDWTSHASAMPGGADHSLFYQCDSKQGAKGPQGPRGPQGSKGEDGYQAPFCLKLGKSQMGNCP